MQLTPDPVAEYRLAHGRKLMVLTKLKNETPESGEFCRIRSVETLSPGLWITAMFLDGSERRLRPDKIRLATVEEERTVSEAEAANSAS